MKLTSVEIHPAKSSDYAVLSFRDPSRSNPYNVKAIVGLDASAIVPRYYANSGNSQDKFYSLSLENREIVLRVELNPRFSQNESYSDLRDALYKMIASSRTGQVELQFKNGIYVTAAISGFVSKFESPHFERTQEVQLTINCSDPMLKGPDEVTVSVTGLNPANTVIQDTMSNAPHGFDFDMNITANFPSLTITDPNDLSWSFGMVPVGGFLNGDVLHFCSELNEKELLITRGATTIYLAEVLAPGSIWPLLFPGINHFSFTNPTHVVWKAISYHPTYWGV